MRIENYKPGFVDRNNSILDQTIDTRPPVEYASIHIRENHREYGPTTYEFVWDGPKNAPIVIEKKDANFINFLFENIPWKLKFVETYCGRDVYIRDDIWYANLYIFWRKFLNWWGVFCKKIIITIEIWKK